MTDATLEQPAQETEDAAETSPEREAAVTFLANQYLNNATLAEALGTVPLNTLIQLVQQQVITQANKEADTLTEEQIQDLAVKNAEAQAAALAQAQAQGQTTSGA